MRIWVFSDAHLEHHKISEKMLFEAGVPEADVCVVPGDMHTGSIAIPMLVERVLPHMPVIYEAGNHDFYGYAMDRMRTAMRREAAQHPDMHFLDPGVVVIKGVRFIGATLWTDYDLNGVDRRNDAMNAAAVGINDHRSIALRFVDANSKKAQMWTPDDARKRHHEERAFIEGELDKPFDGKTVVVTHHAPHPGSIHQRFRHPRHDLLNAAFISNLEPMILEHQPDLWLHGHIHNAADYRVGKTRILANPRGYEIWHGTPPGATLTLDPKTDQMVDPETGRPPEMHRQGPENTEYDPLLVIEI